MIKKDTKVLLPLIKELESYIPLKDKRNESVSTSDVAWQLDHSLKVINRVVASVIVSNPSKYKWRFNKWRTLLFPLGYFPRGRARAPKVVRPPEIISSEDLYSQLSLVYENIEHIKSLHKNAHFTHMIFGQLNKNKTIRFLQMHTNHHLKIIRDILK